jgi:hypothetical protein
MRRSSVFTALGIMAITATTFAGPAKTKEAWVTGQIEAFDGASRSVVVKQGTHELTFVLASDVSLTRGQKTLQAGDLTGNVGRQVKIRYTTTAGTKVADRIEVSESAPAHSPTAPPKK